MTCVTARLELEQLIENKHFNTAKQVFEVYNLNDCIGAECKRHDGTKQIPCKRKEHRKASLPVSSLILKSGNLFL